MSYSCSSLCMLNMFIAFIHSILKPNHFFLFEALSTFMVCIPMECLLFKMFGYQRSSNACGLLWDKRRKHNHFTFGRWISLHCRYEVNALIWKVIKNFLTIFFLGLNLNKNAKERKNALVLGSPLFGVNVLSVAVAELIKETSCVCIMESLWIQDNAMLRLCQPLTGTAMLKIALKLQEMTKKLKMRNLNIQTVVSITLSQTCIFVEKINLHDFLNFSPVNWNIGDFLQYQFLSKSRRKLNYLKLFMIEIFKNIFQFLRKNSNKFKTKALSKWNFCTNNLTFNIVVFTYSNFCT